MLGMFGACEIFWGVSIVEGSCFASPLLSFFSLVVFFKAALVAVGAMELEQLSPWKRRRLYRRRCTVPTGLLL